MGFMCCQQVWWFCWGSPGSGSDKAFIPWESEVWFLPAVVSLCSSGFVKKDLWWGGGSPVWAWEQQGQVIKQVIVPTIVSLCLLFWVQMSFSSPNLTQTHFTGFWYKDYDKTLTYSISFADNVCFGTCQRTIFNFDIVLKMLIHQFFA